MSTCRGGIYGNALQAAVVVGDEQMVVRLLSRGADVNAQGGKYGTALQAAVVKWDQSGQIVHMLLDRDADPNITGGLLGSALQAALTCGHDDAVDLLMIHGAKVDVQGGLNGTHLPNALERPQHNMVKRLLLLGADVNIRGRNIPYHCLRHEAELPSLWNWTGFFDLKGETESSGEKLAVAESNKRFDANFSSIRIVDETPLHCAARSRDANIVKLLLDQGADVNALSGVLKTTLPFDGSMILSYEPLSILTGLTPLHCATMSQNLAIVKVLLASNADVTTRNARGQTALILASIIGSHDIVGSLLAHRSNISDKNALGTTSLIAAARGGHVDVVKLLVEGGADLNARDCLGRTALYEAAYYGQTDIVKYLLTIPPARLELNAKAGVDVTEVEIFETEVDVLNIRSGSYHASVRLEGSALGIHRLCMNGGIMSLEVRGDNSGVRITELVVNGGLLYVTVLGKSPEVCIETLIAEGGYCCIQARGTSAYIQVRNLVIKGGNVDTRTKNYDARVRIRDFEISGGSLRAISLYGTDDHLGPFTVIGNKHGFPPEPQSTYNVDTQETGRADEDMMDLDEVPIQIKCYGKPWGNFGSRIWIMPEVDMDGYYDFDHEGGLTPAEITVRKGFKPLQEYDEYYYTGN